MRDEIEDGSGWGHLVPSKAEKAEERLLLRVRTLESALLSVREQACEILRGDCHEFDGAEKIIEHCDLSLSISRSK